MKNYHGRSPPQEKHEPEYSNTEGGKRMGKTRKKRILSGILAIILICSNFISMVNAASTENKEISLRKINLEMAFVS